ncbi:inosine/guanosine kinase [Paraferrimonas sedimenticola]|uniref:Guanosine-inosine kinase n=1 Tax=Paraferrimonas sedimenticola TaxID=375674 RepID=A0AA37RXW5_9GAMM|nr:inosine/guanosine kinase [Paraferrimonas sedimenticola]GLP96899.1 inosine/guanosine kinase [Paraferrimonas sedimenticola]
MKFPGQRKSKHYFPVKSNDPVNLGLAQHKEQRRTHICGVEQTLVDIEARVSDELLERHNLKKGNSLLIDDEAAKALYKELKESGLISSEFAGGTIGNTLHNYSTLADGNSVMFGVMRSNIEVGSYAYRYLCNTSSRVNLNHLQPVDGPIGRCFALITECGERSFAISKGCMDDLQPESIDKQIVQTSAALVVSSYLLRADPNAGMRDSVLKAIEYAKEADVPVVLTLGTRFLIEQDPQFWRDFIRDNVTILAMNEDEGEALTGESDPLAAADRTLDWADMVLCTAGPIGLYMAGHCDEQYLRVTSHTLLPGAIPEFNRHEFSRPMRVKDCQKPTRVYAHIAPYMGGPKEIRNTNGAGDGALSALLHDLSAAQFHKLNIPNSSKHKQSGLCYSSFSQICKYANRVAFEVLGQDSPRLMRGLPEKEDSLEEAYWER